jgi:glutamine cyclotransferase
MAFLDRLRKKNKYEFMVTYDDNGRYVVDYKKDDGSYKTLDSYETKKEAYSIINQKSILLRKKGHSVIVARDDSFNESLSRIQQLAGLITNKHKES